MSRSRNSRKSTRFGHQRKYAGGPRPIPDERIGDVTHDEKQTLGEEIIEGLQEFADSGYEIPYVSPVPNRTFYVKTRYVFEGRGKPMPFDLEDD